MQLLTLTPRYGKFNQENMYQYQTLSESALSIKYISKHFGVFVGSQF